MGWASISIYLPYQWSDSANKRDRWLARCWTRQFVDDLILVSIRFQIWGFVSNTIIIIDDVYRLLDMVDIGSYIRQLELGGVRMRFSAIWQIRMTHQCVLSYCWWAVLNIDQKVLYRHCTATLERCYNSEYKHLFISWASKFVSTEPWTRNHSTFFTAVPLRITMNTIWII